MNISSSKRSSKCRGSAARIIIWTVVTCVLVFTLLIKFYLNWERTGAVTQNRAKAEGGGANNEGKSGAASGKGFIVGEKALTESEAMAETVIPWLEEHWKITGLAPNDGAGIESKSWREFVGFAIQAEIAGPLYQGEEHLSELAAGYVRAAKGNPWSEYLVAKCLDVEHAERKEMLASAYIGFSEIEGEEWLAFHAMTEWILSPNTEEQVSEEQVRTGGAFGTVFASLPMSAAVLRANTLELSRKDPAELVTEVLKKALDAEKGLSNCHDRLAGFLLLEGRREILFHYLHEQFQDVISDHNDVEPWLKKWVEGKHYHRVAWDARGSGYSSSVTTDGRAIYKRNMVKAKRVLEESWSESPLHPGIASELIEVALAEKGDDAAKREIKKWFSEVLKVQVDYAPAVKNVLWGLRPRWYGSLREMTDFGEECLESERFDSSLPLAFLQAHRDASSEWDLPANYFPKMRERDRLKNLFEGLESEEARSPWRWHDRSEAILTHFFCGHYEEASLWLEKLEQEELHPLVSSNWGSPKLDWVAGKIEAFTGPYGKDLSRAELDAMNFRSGPAYETYREVISKTGDESSELMKGYLGFCLEAARIEHLIRSKGEVKSFCPPEDGKGWLMVNLEHGSGKDLVFKGGDEQVIKATCAAKVGPKFEMDGVIEAENVEEGARFWISFGYPDRAGASRWGAVSFVFEEDELAVLLSNGFNNPEEVEELESRAKIPFTLNVGPGGVSLRIGDEQIWDNVPPPRNFVKEQHAQVGFGAFMPENGGQIRLSDVELRRK